MNSGNITKSNTLIGSAIILIYAGSCEKPDISILFIIIITASYQLFMIQSDTIMLDVVGFELPDFNV